MNRRRYLAIFAVVLSNFIGATMVIPVLPLFTEETFGASPEMVTLVYGSFFVAQFIAGPFLGHLSDMHGRRPVLLVSQIGTVLSFLIMAWAGSLPVLFLARILDGITGGNVIVAQAYLSDLAPPKQRTRALGLTWAAFGIGLVLGSLIGGSLATLGPRVPFFAGALISSVTVLLTWVLLPETLTARVRAERQSAAGSRMAWRELLHNTPLLLILVIGFCGQLAMMMMQSTFALYAERVLFPNIDHGAVTQQAGLLLALHGVGQVLTQLVVIERLVERFGECGLVIMGAALRALALWAFVVLPFPWSVGALGMLGFALGSGLMMPSLQSLATLSVREEISGEVLGVYQSSVSLGVIVGSVSSGFLFSQSPFMPYLVGGLVIALTIIPAVWLLRLRAPLHAPA